MSLIARPRSTKARRTLVLLLQSTQVPQSLQWLHRQVKTELPTVAFSTIFRLIRALETSGDVVRIDWRERGSHYEWAHDHHHLVCRVCGAVRDLSDAELNFRRKGVERQTGYQITAHSIELEGLCPECQQGFDDKRTKQIGVE